LIQQQTIHHCSELVLHGSETSFGFERFRRTIHLFSRRFGRCQGLGFGFDRFVQL
jgi:hypothetical protein